MISNHEINAYVARDPYISQIYGGTLAIDELPRQQQQARPTLFIVNTDPAHLPGSHWLGVYVSDRSEHFDSAGQQPLPRLKNFLASQSEYSVYMYNSMRIQDNSSYTCGLFCLMYAYYRSRGVSFNSFLSMFSSSNLEQNESVVKYFYKMTK